MEKNQIPIITRDKNFPENGGNLKITLEGESTVKLTRQALSKLLERQIPRRKRRKDIPINTAWLEFFR